MGRILLLGYSPLPSEGRAETTAQQLRTEQFARALCSEGHTLSLLCCRPVEAGEAGAAPDWLSGGCRHLPPDRFATREILQSIHNSFDPQAVVSAGSFLSPFAAALVVTDRPVWIDIAGDTIAEAQMKAARAGDDRCIDLYFEKYLPAIRRGDAFSVISKRQRFALLGELGMAGRLTAGNAGFELVHVVPAWIGGPDPGPVRHGGKLKGRVVEERDFVVLWTGGYNTWADVDTLFKGLEAAMDASAAVKFVSAGAGIPGHDEATYEAFRQVVHASRHRDRFIFMGRLPCSELPGLYAESDIGVSCDRICYEAELGMRNRILDWLVAGLPALTTCLCEFAAELAAAGAAVDFPPGDPTALAGKILWAASAPEELREVASRGRTYAEKHHSLGVTMEPLLRWASSPQHSPDFGKEPAARAADPFRLMSEIETLRGELSRVYSTPTWKLLSRAHGALRKLTR